MKKLLLILGLCIVFWPTRVQAEEYCKNYNKKNVYEETYCKLNLNQNGGFEDKVSENIAKQLGYNKEITVWILGQGEGFTCREFKIYIEEKGLKADDLHSDMKRACNLSTGAPHSAKEMQRLLLRVNEAYLKEKNLQSNKTRLEETFKSSERYWDGQLEISTPFDLMVDLNLMDDLLFGSQAQWVNDSFAFSKGQDLEEEKDSPLFQPPVDPQEAQLENLQQQGQQNQEQNVNLPSGFIHPDCFKSVSKNSPLCGNGIVDVLSGETCDDGNKLDGDGCNNTCKTTAGSLQCKDPDVLTLQAFSELPLGENNNPLCPPNLLAAQNQSAENNVDSPQVSQSSIIAPSTVPEAIPFVGGTLSPISAPPSSSCPAGKSLVSVSVAGGGKGKEISKCIPTDFCGNFNDIRTALFGEGWEESEKADIAASIETAVCVNFSTANRPLSPYAVNEGCIDCHFRAMADALEKALSSNVTPLVNTTSAFALTNRWGPNFSFDLNIAVKRLATVDLEKRSKEPTEEEKENQKQSNPSVKAATDEAATKNKAGESSLQAQTTSTETLSNQSNNVKNVSGGISENLENYRALSGSMSDIAFSSQVIPQIAYLKGSFKDIQSSVNSMATIAEELSVKPICKL